MSTSTTQLVNFLLYSFLISLIPILTGLSRYRYLTKITLYVWLISVTSFSFDVLSRIIGLIGGISNLFLGYLYVPLEFFIITLIYKVEFKTFLRPYLLEAVYIAFILFTFIDIFIIQGFFSNNSYQRFVESSISIIYVLLYFYKVVRELKIINLEREPLFWFSAGILLYFSGSIFIFISSNLLLSYSNKFALTFWCVHAIFLILFHLMNTMAIWLSPRN